MSTFKTSRAFAAPPEAVFDALSDPARLARWWGPDGFRNTFEVAEVAASIRHIVEPANEQNLFRWAAEVARRSRSGT